MKIKFQLHHSWMLQVLFLTINTKWIKCTKLFLCRGMQKRGCGTKKMSRLVAVAQVGVGSVQIGLRPTQTPMCSSRAGVLGIPNCKVHLANKSGPHIGACPQWRCAAGTARAPRSRYPWPPWGRWWCWRSLGHSALNAGAVPRRTTRTSAPIGGAGGRFNGCTLISSNFEQICDKWADLRCIR